jgi:ankyrin repeat protein
MNAATVLAWAADNGHADIVRSLIAKGVDVNARDRDGKGNSALVCAVWSADLRIVRLLIKNGWVLFSTLILTPSSFCSSKVLTLTPGTKRGKPFWRMRKNVKLMRSCGGS